MFTKYVKDGAHNRFPAYCCEDIDKKLAYLIEAVEALVAGTVPDGAVTLAKLAEDARTYTREINKGALLCEWIGTEEEYALHLAENGGKPLANVKYTITDKAPFEWQEIAETTISTNSSISLELDADSNYLFEIAIDAGVFSEIQNFMLSTYEGKNGAGVSYSPVFATIHSFIENTEMLTCWKYNTADKTLYFRAFDHAGNSVTENRTCIIKYTKIT